MNTVKKEASKVGKALTWVAGVIGVFAIIASISLGAGTEMQKIQTTQNDLSAYMNGNDARVSQLEGKVNKLEQVNVKLENIETDVKDIKRMIYAMALSKSGGNTNDSN
jgi:TolA-binding protein